MKIRQWRGTTVSAKNEEAEGTNVVLTLHDDLVVHAYENPQTAQFEVTVTILRDEKGYLIGKFEGQIAKDFGSLHCGDWEAGSPESFVEWGKRHFPTREIEGVKIAPCSHEDWKQATPIAELFRMVYGDSVEFGR